MATADIGSELRAKEVQFLSLWRANVCREVASAADSLPLWRKENQLRKLGGGQPREAAANIGLTEGQAAIAVETMPAQGGDIEKLAESDIATMDGVREFAAERAAARKPKRSSDPGVPFVTKTVTGWSVRTDHETGEDVIDHWELVCGHTAPSKRRITLRSTEATASAPDTTSSFSVALPSWVEHDRRLAHAPTSTVTGVLPPAVWLIQPPMMAENSPAPPPA